MSRAATTRVKRGARWLDENFPGWEKRINIDTLILSETFECVCGQVFSDDGAKYGNSGYDYARRHLFGQANSWISAIVKMEAISDIPDDGARSSRVSVALGFCDGPVLYSEDGSAPNSDYTWVDFDELQDAWAKLLTKRAKVSA